MTLRHTCFVTQTLEADPDCLDGRGLCPYGCVKAEREATDVAADAPDEYAPLTSTMIREVFGGGADR